MRPPARPVAALVGALLPALAVAEVPLPAWREEATVAVWTELDRRITAACTWREGRVEPDACDPAALAAAIAWGQQARRDVADDGRFAYLIGLACRYAGALDAAEAAWREAVRLDPDRADAWFDLGQLLAARQDWDGADRAFRNVVRLRPSGPTAWPGWFQLAQTAGWRRDVVTFESALREALRFGFSFRLVLAQPAWRGFFRDPVLHDTLDAMLAVHAQPFVRESLQRPPP